MYFLFANCCLYCWVRFWVPQKMWWLVAVKTKILSDLWQFQRKAIMLLSLFRSSSTLETGCAVFSCPQTFLADRSNNTSWTNYLRWICREQKNLTHVFCAISPSRWPKILKCTCFSMMDKRPTVAISAATRPSRLSIWKPTCLFIVERNLSIAHSATFPAHMLVPSRDTCLHIQERSLLFANSATTPADKLVTWRNTCWFIVERSLLFAHSANTPPQELIPSRHTC